MNKEIEALLREILELDQLSGERLDKFRSCKYLIVLDMGCGSTSAALLDLEGYKGSQENSPQNYIYPITWDYRQISVSGDFSAPSTDNVSIPTLIGYGGLKPVVGPQALTTGNSCENFKSCPNGQNLNQVVLHIGNFDGSVTPKRLGEVWPDYFDCILSKVCEWCGKRNVGPADRKEMENSTMVMAAHPAGPEWSEPEVLKNYRNLISKGTRLPDENILTISEAKAVMQYARRRYRELDFDKGVIIIDIGASTVDIEYLTRKSPDPVEYSLTLGGRNVDQLLAHYILETIFPEAMKKYPRREQVPEEDFFEERGINRSVFMYDVRLWKESVSDMERDPAFCGKSMEFPMRQYGAVELNGEILRGLLGDDASDPLNGAVFGDKKISVVYELPMALYVKRRQDGYRAVQLVEDTWYGHLENLIRYVMNALGESGRETDQVIVTGGSCRLAGLKEHLWKAVQSTSMGGRMGEEQLVYLDRELEYENSVPFGGGYYVGGILKHMDALAAFPQRLQKVFSSELEQVAACRLAWEVNGLVNEIAAEVLDWWCGLEDGEPQCSTNGLNEYFLARCRQVIFGKNNKLEKAVARAAGKLSLKDDFPKTMQEIRDLLEKLAQTTFTGELSADAVKIELPPEDVASAVRGIDPSALSVGFFAAILGGLQDLGNAILRLFGMGLERDDILRAKYYRCCVRDAYKRGSNFAVKPQLKAAISQRLKEKFGKTEIFGIPDRLIRSIKNDIMCALYLNSAGGRSHE